MNSIKRFKIKFFVVIFFAPQFLFSVHYPNYAQFPTTVYVTNTKCNSYADFNSLSNASSRSMEYWEKAEANARYLRSEWNSREDRLKERKLYGAFCNSYDKLGNCIYELSSSLKGAQPGQSTLIKQAELLVVLSRFNPQSQTLKEAANTTFKALEPYWFDENGQMRIESPLNWYDVYGKAKHWYNEWRYNAIVARIESDLNEWYKTSAVIESADNTLYNRHFEQANSYLYEIADIKDLNAIADCCNAANFVEAYKIVQKYEQRFANNPNDNPFRKIYLDEFYKGNTAEGIDKKYINDPIIATFKDLHKRETPSSYNEILKPRHELKSWIEKECNIKNPSKELEHIIYEIIEAHANGMGGVIKYCAQHLSADHPDPARREIYFALHNANNGLPKFAACNSLVSQAKLSPEINKLSHAKDRILLAELGSLNAEHFYVKKGTSQVIEYINRSCMNDEFAVSYQTLAHKIGDALLERGDPDILGLSDFSVKLTNKTHEEIKDRVVLFIADKLSDTGKIAKIETAYAQMLAGNQIQQSYLEAALYPSVCEMALELDIKIYGIPKNPQELAFTCSEIKRHAEICRDMIKNGAIDTEKIYISSPEIRIYELSRGNDPRINECFKGNQREHYFYEYKIKSLQDEAETVVKDLHPTIRKIFQLGIKYNALADAAFKVKSFPGIIKNLASAKTVYSFIDQVCAQGDKMLQAASKGIIKAVENITHMAQNPEETAENFITGLWNIACLFDSKARQLSEINIAVFAEPERAEKLLGEHNVEIKALAQEALNTIQEKGLEGCTQEVVQFVTEAYLTSRIFNAVKTGSGQFGQRIINALSAHKIQAEAGEMVAAGIEDVGVKAAQSAKTFALNEAQEVAKQGAKVSEAVALVIENAEAKAAQVVEDASAQQAKQITKLSAANEALIAEFNPAHYDPAIIDPQILSKAVEKLKDIPGAMGQNGPLKQVLENAKIGLNANPSLAGVAYELEKALELEGKGEKIIELGKKIMREFDIVTKTKLIECKNIDWAKLQLNEIKNKIETLCQQKSIAKKIEMQFELHSKKPIPTLMKELLIKKNITFIEG